MISRKDKHPNTPRETYDLLSMSIEYLYLYLYIIHHNLARIITYDNLLTI